MRQSNNWSCMSCSKRHNCSLYNSNFNLLGYCPSYSDEDDYDNSDDLNDSYSIEDLEDW